MNKEDKILISAYLDSELDFQTVDYVESLVLKDQDAHDYLNKLKISNNELDSFYQSENMELLDASISKFVEDLKTKETASSFQFSEVISSFFFSRQLVTYSLTAMIFLTAGLLYNDGAINDDKTMQTLIDIGVDGAINDDKTMQRLVDIGVDGINFDLDDIIYTRDVWKTRSLTNVDIDIKSVLETTLNEMVENKSANGVLKYGKTYNISINQKNIHQDNLSCYAGEVWIGNPISGATSRGITSKDEIKQFTFCKSNKDSLLSLDI